MVIYSSPTNSIIQFYSSYKDQTLFCDTKDIYELVKGIMNILFWKRLIEGLQHCLENYKFAKEEHASRVHQTNLT